MGTLVRALIHDEEGQDVVEYTLLLMFIAVATAALAVGGGNETRSIWSTANSHLTNANVAAS